MKLLFSITDLNLGGSELFLTRLTNYLQQKHTIVIYNHTGNSNLSVTSELSSKVRVVESVQYFILRYYLKIRELVFINFLEKKLGITYQLQRFWIKRFIKKEKIDGIVSFMYESDSFICSSLKKEKIPIIISIRGCYSLHYYENKNNNEALTYLLEQYKKVFTRANGFTWQTNENLKVFEWISLPVNPLNKRINNGLPPYQKKGSLSRSFFGISEESVVIGMLARGVEYKGWEALISSFENIQSNISGKKLFLLLGGDSQYVQGLKKANETNSSIIFAGEIKNSQEFISLFDIAACPSHVDSMPNSVIEYLACSKPVVATRIGEIPEMISFKDQEAGVLVGLDEIGRVSVSQLTNALLTLIESESKRKRLSKIAELAFRKFDMNECANEYETFFQKVLAFKE